MGSGECKYVFGVVHPHIREPLGITIHWRCFIHHLHHDISSLPHPFPPVLPLRKTHKRVIPLIYHPNCIPHIMVKVCQLRHRVLMDILKRLPHPSVLALKGNGWIHTFKFFPRRRFTISRNSAIAVDSGSGCRHSSCGMSSGWAVDIVVLLSQLFLWCSGLLL